MNKSEASKELKNSYLTFNENISMMLFFKLDLPELIDFLKYYKKLTVADLMKNKNLSENQKLANKMRIENQIEKVDDYPRIIYSMSLVYTVASFEVFLKDTIKLLLRFDKNILAKSEKKISYSELFNFSSYEDLSNYLADGFVNELTYKNIVEQIRFLNERIQLGLSFKKKNGIVSNRNFIDLHIVNEIFSTRNILLHNSGVVNKRYLELNPKSKFDIGDVRALDKDYLFSSWGEIRHNGEALYRQTKFYLKNFGKSINQ